jgi:hypothetical protein
MGKPDASELSGRGLGTSVAALGRWMTEHRLRGIIVLKLEANLLPRQQSGRLWAGPGNNEVCSA